MDNAIIATPARHPATLSAAADNPAPTGAFGLLSAMPVKAKLMLMFGTAALMAVLVALFVTSRDGQYAPLFAQLSEKDAAAVTAQLTQFNVPYRLADGSGMLLVPAERIAELRLKLAQVNLPKGTVSGYELFDNPAFGQSQQQERNTVKRALEGELVRSISSLAAVQSARVHLALPSQNGFFREQQKPGAAVLISLHPGRTLDRTQVAGIVHLVSSSVPELSPKAVSVLDQNSNLLSGPGEAGNLNGLDTQQLQYVQQMESSYLKRVLEILEPVLGRENLRATVTAEVDFTQQESTTEAFKPNQGAEAAAAVRSQSTADQGGSSNSVPSGVPGAVSNQPPQAATAPLQGASAALHAAQSGAAGANGARRENAVNYELDKTVSLRRNASGTVKRLNAAVLVNHRSTTDPKGKVSSVALPAEELDKLTSLVQESIGFNKERGDSVKVVNIPFRIEAQPKAEEVPLWKQTWLLDLLRAAAAPTALLLVALLLVNGVVRPALRAATPLPAPAPGATLDEVVGEETVAAQAQAARAAQAAQGEAEAQGSSENKNLPALRKLALERPHALASVARAVMSGEKV